MRPNAEVPTHVGLIRIQNEISEVEKREIELRKEHETSRTSSVNDDSSEMSSSDSPEPISTPIVNIDSKDHFKKNKIIEPQPKPQYLPAPGLTRALSTPQLFLVSPVKNFNINAPHKGMMEKFIASRGKMIGNQHSPAQLNFKKNLMMSPIEFNSGSMKAFTNMEKPAIERDVQGRPVRRGYIPVEEKIQSELRDLKTRECELKRLHKLNVRDSDEEYNSSDELDSDWSPINGKLSKSIDALNGSSLSPSPEEQRPIPQPRSAFLRPAVSLAQLCDLDESSETPSSHKLIERWESIIQENQQREKSHILH